MNRLQLAMENANLEDLGREADAIGREAVMSALAPPVDDGRAKAEAEAARQRDLDAALADAIEVVARHRVRLGRRTCSVHDGQTVRRVFELLRGVLPISGDADPGF